MVAIHKYSTLYFCATVDWRVVTFDTAQSSGTPRRDADIGQVKDTENNRRSIGNIDVFLCQQQGLDCGHSEHSSVWPDWQKNGRQVGDKSRVLRTARDVLETAKCETLSLIQGSTLIPFNLKQLDGHGLTFLDVDPEPMLC